MRRGYGGLLMIMILVQLLVCALLSTSGETTTTTTTTTTDDTSTLSILILTSIYPAHFFPLVVLSEELISRGHNITMVGPVLEGYEWLPIDAENKGITFLSAGLEPRSTYDSSREAGKHEGSMITAMYNITKTFTKGTAYLHKMIKLLKGMNQYDYDYIICDNAALPVGIYLLNHWNTDKLLTLLSPLPIHPLGMTIWPLPKFLSPFTDDMSFKDRLINTVVYGPMERFIMYIFRYFLDINEDINSNDVIPDYFLGVKYPILYNTLIGFDWPRTTLPLQHYVGPLITSSPAPLDHTLSDWLNDKPIKSVVYVSMGTSVDVTQEIASAVLSLANDYYIVWSCRNDLKEYSINKDKIYVTPWTSQVTLLNHSSIVYSVLQCGVTSVQESLYFSVPVICIPSAFDQYDTSLRLVSNGLGAQLLPYNITKESMIEAVQHVNSNEVKEKVAKMRKMMIANNGVKRASDLIELYADIGHSHGIPSYAKYNWYWYEFYNIDVYIVLVLIIILMVWCIRRICTVCCCRRYCLTRKVKKE